MNELPTPTEVAQDPGAVELLRAWVVGPALHCAVLPDAFEDPGSWGEVLADLVQHLARARLAADGTPSAETLLKIYQVFQEELRPLLPPDKVGAP
jgi:hypothetical protein